LKCVELWDHHVVKRGAGGRAACLVLFKEQHGGCNVQNLCTTAFFLLKLHCNRVGVRELRWLVLGGRRPSERRPCSRRVRFGKQCLLWPRRRGRSWGRRWLRCHKRGVRGAVGGGGRRRGATSEIRTKHRRRGCKHVPRPVGRQLPGRRECKRPVKVLFLIHTRGRRNKHFFGCVYVRTL